MFGEAFSPSGISSFFEVCTREKNGTTISDPVKVGARGGGFALSKGVTTGIYVEESDVKDIEVFINNSQTWKAKTTETTIELILRNLEKQYKIKVEHAVEVPIGAGFGTSAAGAFSCGLALSHALRLPLTYNQIARIAHMAEVMCNTGLGTVEGLTIGGLVLVIESGAMGIGLVDRIPIDPNLKIVAGVFKSMDKASVIQSSETVQKINKIARKTLKSILHEPTPKNFLRSCKNFALDSGLASKRVIKLIEDVEEAGAIGATQNMIGEAVHALTTREFLDDVHSVFAKHLPEERIVVSDIDFQGARLR